MSGVTTPELVAAASNAGGLGILGAGRMLPNQILDAIHKIKKLTNHTYGVNREQSLRWIWTWYCEYI